MPSARQNPIDPFTANPALQPTTSNTTSLRTQPSQHSLRSTTSTASTRQRQQGRDLFAPSLSRRPTSRATPRVEDAVLADSDSEPDLSSHHTRQRRQQQRKHRLGSPEAKHSSERSKAQEEPEMVNRQRNGCFLLGLVQWSDNVAVPIQMPPSSEEERDQEEVDQHYAHIARSYWTSGAALGGRNSRKHEEEMETVKVPMMARLREQVMQQLEEERWMYEPMERFQAPVP